MSEVRLIDANELKKQFSNDEPYGAGEILGIIDNAPTVESENVAEHLRNRIKDINHEITIPQSNEAKCFLDGKRKAFQYVLNLLGVKKNEQ